jgi:acetylornithine deacetylase/succinyl-diaminopimelate desuccinylase-like protein
MPLDLLKTLCDLVRLPSVNPMGRSGPGGHLLRTVGSRTTSNDCFENFTCHTVRQEIAPGRDNIVARLDGDTPAAEGGFLLMFEAHQDTVPVEGMTIEPWEPQVRQGRVYGRGACDIKGAWPVCWPHWRDWPTSVQRACLRS